jgi:C4-dicarboxylate transporter, DctM subunit
MIESAIGIALIGACIILVAGGLWIAFGLAAIGLVAIWFFLPPMITARMTEVIPFNTLDDFILAAIPMFIFMGALLFKGDIASKIYRGLSNWVSLLPGGLLQTNVVACAIFGACSGSSLAGAATMGSMAVTELRHQGYEKKIVYGSLASAGTLATMIPPSILFILYGSFAGVSVGQLFIAGIVPGLMLILLFMAYILVRALLKPSIAPRPPVPRLRDVLKSLSALAGPLLLIATVMGSIYTGIATPTESAAVGSVGALLILLLEGRLSRHVVMEAARMAVRTTCMIALMMVGTQFISVALSVLQIPASIAAWIAEQPLEPWMIAALVGVFYIVLGALIEGTSMFFLTFPVIYPVMMSIGYDPIWFGVIMALFIEMSLITPPVGLNLFIIQQVSGEQSAGAVIRGSMPFFALMVLALVLFIAFPGLVLWLPNLLW